MPHANQDRDGGNAREPGTLQPAHGAFTEMNVAYGWEGHRLVALAQNREQAPDNEYHHHHGRDLHNAQRLLARLVHALDVLTPEVESYKNSESGRKVRWVSMCVLQMKVINAFIQQPRK